MSELVFAGGGCVAGILTMWGVDRLKKKPPEPQGKPGVRPVPGMAGAASPGSKMYYSSPMKFMSPGTHLRRDDPVGAPTERISADAFLTRNKADFGKAPGVDTHLDTSAFKVLLGQLIGQTKLLQNNPRLGIHPQEKLAAQIVMKHLHPYSEAAGGPLKIEELEYVPGRSNLKVTYPGTTAKTVAFVGSHFDVVPADPEGWDRDPFTMSEEDGKLYGRGTTDCLGHVALLTILLAELGKKKPKTERSIVVLFIAGEEGGEMNVGVDLVLQRGKLAEVKDGPVYWVDSADSQPCCGSAGMMSWQLKCSGRLFHSGIPQKAINSIELASEALSTIQYRFYEDFPPHPSEEAYGFGSGSHMKPTQIECKKGSLNQICPETSVFGDIRLSPFYEVEQVKEAIDQYIVDLNESVGDLPTKGDWSKFVLPESVAVQPGELKKGKIEMIWTSDMNTCRMYAGIAVSLSSDGHKALVQACRETYASVKPFSVNGSLPLVKMMQKQGFDIQLCGFGLMSVYHGINEYCEVKDMEKAYEVILRTVCLLECA